MCGACGERRSSDDWSSVADSRRARWQVAALVNELLRSGPQRSTVTATPGGWLVRSGTGRVDLADTLTALWQALSSARPTPEAVREVLDRHEPSPVAAAVLSSYGQGAPAPRPRQGSPARKEH